MKKALNSVRNQGSSKKALITGIAGFAGSHLAEHLLSKKIAVFGLVHPGHLSTNLDHVRNKIKIIACNLLDKKNLDVQITNQSFDYVFHLAAFSSPAKSFQDPQVTFKNNVMGQLNLLEVLKDRGSKAKILIVGSSDEYGSVSLRDLPVDESTPIAPVSPYAVSKVVQDFLGQQFFLHHQLDVVRVRPFNHIGPRQSTAFVIPAFAAQIARLEKRGQGTIKVGNLAIWRDFTDVRDMVRAYFLALDKGKVGEVYNIGSGRPYRIGDLLGKLLSTSYAKIKVVCDKKLMRTNDIKKIYCDYSKFHKDTGWRPKIAISKTLSDTIEYERNKLSQSVESKSKV